MSGQARDIKLSRERIEGYRNFGTKLWNATRFTQVNGCERVEDFDPASVKAPLNIWIVGKTVRAAQTITAALADCGFDEAAGEAYRFIWNVYCDWYVELAKPVLNGENEWARDETRAAAAWVLDIILKLLHPIMPFLTEELWEQTAAVGAPRLHTGFLMTARWPELADSLINAEVEKEIELVIDAITEGRSVRAELNVPLSARPPLLVLDYDDRQNAILTSNRAMIVQLLRVEDVWFVDSLPEGAIPFMAGGVSFALPVAEFIDVAAERARLGKEVGALTADIDRTAKKLANADFVARAPEEVVEENRERLADAEAAKAKLETALSRLTAVV